MGDILNKSEPIKQTLPTVTFTFDLYEDNDLLAIFMHARNMYSLIQDIDDKCRSLLKYQAASKELDKFAEEIRELIWPVTGAIERGI